MSSANMSRLVLGHYSDQQKILRAIAFVIVILLGSYAIVKGAQSMKVFYKMTVDLGTGAVGLNTWFEFFTKDAPLLTIALICLAAGNAYRGGGILMSCVLTSALIIGMVFAIFGNPPVIMNVADIAYFAAPIYGILGWFLGYSMRILQSQYTKN
ncbi:hypothetical protein A4G99_23540 [Haladaptatus sp. R4]|uniref:hypothetical protein n=1 Tax=Haladaptatus sp. R4 TaxID=1679489 RepID=UPI0007B4A9BE|nr:hypothetical protein [Haladaptatus sp. R4]KZN26053.1 hypothetical protein A4G99_23540 [Haladaptatus sp. R4]